jgi:NAD-dependent deacetylase
VTTKSSIRTSAKIIALLQRATRPRLPFVALNAGAMVLEINPNPTSLTEAAHFSLRGSSGRVLPEIVQTAWGVEVTAPRSNT